MKQPPDINQPPLRLPVNGRWFVFWGGTTEKQNYHHTDTAQRYALDLIKLGENGKSYSNDGSKNTDYFAFGESILVPADGVVVEAVDGFRDNVPQKTTNDYAYDGNHVIIRHTDSVYSVLCHLKQGSVRVKQGDKVETGNVLGECGNSGNSSEPHLHYHLMDDEVLTVFDADYTRQPKARGIVPHFLSIEVTDGSGQTRMETNYSPVKGDKLRNI